MAKLLLLVFIVFNVLTPTLFAAPLPNFPIAKRNCVDRCGNISIPFPFGTTKHCYRDDDFLVTCNETFDPPKLFVQYTELEITDISFDGQLRVMQSKAKSCYDPNGTRTSSNKPFINLPAYFTLNNAANIFTVLGCGSYGTMEIERGSYRGTAIVGCSVTCHSDSSQESCQTLVPEDVSTVSLVIPTRSSSRTTRGYNRQYYECSSAFIAEKSEFTSYPEYFTYNLEKLPVVVDWSIGQWSCELAQITSEPFACKGLNSECYNNGRGYLCRCKQGYEGSPYLVNGCQDVDECKLNICVSKCENTQGGFNCSCPEGYSGDGRRNGTGCVGGVDSSGGGGGGGDSNMYKIVAGIAVGIIVVLFVTCWLYVELRRRKLSRMKQKYFLQNGGVLLQEKLARRERSPVTVSIFSSTDLQKATNNFHNSMIVGQGGFGTVYKGLLTNNKIVAVKKSKEVDPNQIEQFINEVIILSQINHRNVVKLLGCCLETQAPLLVYGFISNGSLFEHIHKTPKTLSLNWEVRLKIATDTAGVLSYLHSATSIPIIHRDVKSANILLDQTFTAKVSDFGASRLVPLDQTQLSTLVQGTFGYLDPEYMQTNRLTEKSDVYSFGVVVVELLTGMKVLSYERPEEAINLSNFFLSMLKEERLFEILDDHIVCQRNREQLIAVARIAKRCLKVRGEDRPSMKEVAMELEGLRLGGKHSWGQTEENIEEMDSLLGERINYKRLG